MYTYWRIERTPIGSNGLWDEANMVVLTDFRMPNIMMKTGDGKDSFSLKIDNFSGRYNNYFQERDRIKLFIIKNNSVGFTTSDMVLDGSISNIKQDVTTNSSQINIDGYNFTEALFGALVFIDSEGLTIDQTLKQGVEQIGGLSQLYTISWAATNPTKRSDGTDFPLVGKRYYYVTFNKVVEDLSASTKTGDGNYIWYVDSNNVVHWVKRTATVVDTFDANTDNYTSLNIGKDTSGVKNFIIVKGGYDAKDKPIQTRYVNYASVAKNGYKYYFLIDDTRLAENTEERDASSLGVSRMRDYTWGSFKPLWSTVTYNNLNTYNDALRVHIKEQLKEVGKRYAELYEFGTLKININIKPLERTWKLGNTISCNIPQLSDVPINLLVEEIQYTNEMFSYVLKEVQK